MDNQSSTRMKSHSRSNSGISTLSRSHKVQRKQVEKLPRRATHPKLSRSNDATLAVSSKNIEVANVRQSTKRAKISRSVGIDKRTQDSPAPFPAMERRTAAPGGHARSKTDVVRVPKKTAPLGLRDVTNSGIALKDAGKAVRPTVNKIIRSKAVKESGTTKRPAKRPPAQPVTLPVPPLLGEKSSSYSEESEASADKQWNPECEAQIERLFSDAPAKKKSVPKYAPLSPKEEHDALLGKFQGKLDKLRLAMEAGNDKAIQQARIKALRLADDIRRFEEEAYHRLDNERRHLEQSLACEMDAAETTSLKAKLDQIVATQSQMRRVKAWSKTVLNTTLHPKSILSFVEPPAIRNGYLVPRLPWQDIRSCLDELRSVGATEDKARDSAKAKVNDALRNAMEYPDLHQDLVDFVGAFSAGHDRKESEVSLLQRLITDSVNDPARNNLLTQLRLGVELEFESEGRGIFGEALQTPLDHIASLLAMMFAEPDGAGMFCEMVDAHRKTQVRTGDFTEIGLMSVMETVGSESDGERTRSFIRFVRLVAEYGHRLEKAGVANPSGARSAQAIQRALTLAGVQ